jgi:hypothetical protein
LSEATLDAVTPGTEGAAPDGATESAPVSYRETLYTPWWWYALGVGVAGVLAAEFHISGIGLTDWIPYCVLLPLSIVLVWWMGHARLEISEGEIRIRGAHLPLQYVSGAVALDARTLRRVVGREGDPAAFVSMRPWIGPGVQFWLDDEDDPTPYWVVSTRHPDRVLAALRSGR